MALDDDPAPAPIYRRAARVILLDPTDRVLVSHDTYDTGEDWWVLPGGGVEAGESLSEAALRELREETGFADVALGPVVVRHRFLSHLFGQDVDQDEWIFLGRTAGGVPDMAGLNALERTFVGGFQWLSADELSALPELVYPLGLSEMVAAILADGPPDEPWRVSGTQD